MEPIAIKNEEVLSVDEKCAEIYRNPSKGTFSFLCFACGEVLDASGDAIFKHLGTHYYFEGEEYEEEENLIGIDEKKIEENKPVVLYPLEEVNIDGAQLPPISEECSKEGTSNSMKDTSSQWIPRKKKMKSTSNPKFPNATSMIKCEICGNILKTIKSFKVHMRTHLVRKQKYTCKFCNETLNDPKRLHCHYKDIHPEEKDELERIARETDLQCIFCEEIFNTNLEKLQHCREKHPEYYTPDEAENVFRKKRREKYHANTNCDICNRTFETRGKYEHHMQTHSETKYPCDLCDKIFAMPQYLRKHRKRRHAVEYVKVAPVTEPQNKPILKCDICGQTCKTKGKLNVHMQIHSDQQHQCDQCGKIFALQSYLKKHMNTIHNPNITRYPCPVCGMEVLKLKQHMQTHTEREKLFECTQCSKRFINNSELNIHMRSHTGIKPYQCEICGKSYYQRSLLALHVRRQHTNDRPVQCQFCDERFFNNSQKKEHERKHTGEKPYKCDECGMAFRTSSILRQHRGVHESEKKYSCKYCDMKFTQSSGRRSHEKSRHGVA